MRILIFFACLATLVSLTGCATSPMITPDGKTKTPNGYHVNVSNYEKIHDKNINLEFKVADGADIGEFYWKETQEDVIDRIQSKGIKLTPEGRTVTVYINGFTVWGSSHAQTKTSIAPQAGGIVGSLGGSIIQGVLANTAERQLDKKLNPGTEDNGKNFVPEVSFSIVSDDYESTVGMKSDIAFVNYISMTKKLTAQAISEFFTGTQ